MREMDQTLSFHLVRTAKAGIKTKKKMAKYSRATCKDVQDPGS